MSVQSVVVDKKSGTVTIVLDYSNGEPSSKSGKMREIANTGGFARVTKVDGTDREISANIYVGYRA